MLPFSVLPLNFSHTCLFPISLKISGLYSEVPLVSPARLRPGKENSFNSPRPASYLFTLILPPGDSYVNSEKILHLSLFWCLVKKKNCLLLKLSQLCSKIIIITMKSNGNLLPIIKIRSYKDVFDQNYFKIGCFG